MPARSAIVVIGSSVACWAIARSGFSADIVVLQEGSRGRSHSTGTMRGDGRDEGGAKRRREDEASPAARFPRAPSSAPARSSLVREQERCRRRPMSAVGWGVARAGRTGGGGGDLAPVTDAAARVQPRTPLGDAAVTQVAG